ncbi:MAG TPA: dihydrodipicolinate reductase C-terminal domain-containing protein [bacterium]|nr:dihydrodipicolinate reductase C-terminal domain-containing protein [bacterium]
MRTAIIGYGRMGQGIARLLGQEHQLLFIVEPNKDLKTSTEVRVFNRISEVDPSLLNKVDIFFEFTTPDSAFNNIKELIKIRPDSKIICGTTSWDTKELEKLIENKKASLLISSNFSIGVKALKPCLKEISSSLNKKGFKVELTDLHHKHKKDSPSGTAKMLAKIIENEGLVCPIKSIREDEHVGTHTIRFESDFEIIEIKHEAKNRDVFCIGAIRSAEWLKDQASGLYFL